MYIRGFGNNIQGIYEENYFNQPFGKRNETEIALDNYSNEILTSLIGVDGTNFSTNINKFDCSKMKEFDVNFLESGTDGVLCTGLNDINKQLFDVKNNIGIIVGVGDCGVVNGASLDGSTMFSLHCGYKGVFGLDNNYMGILYNIFYQIRQLRMNPKDFLIDISPMAGSDFEVNYEDIYKKLSAFLINYRDLSISDYIKKTDIKNNEQKGELDLQLLIIDILKYYGFDKIFKSNYTTTDINNNWPSHRLYSNGLQESPSRLSSTLLKRIS